MNVFRKSLNVKVAVLVTLLTVVTLTAIFLGIYYWQKQSLVSQIHNDSTRASAFLSLAIQDPMVIGDDAGTRAKFTDIAARFDEIKVHLTDFKGNVTYSTEEEAQRQDLLKTVENEDLSDMLVKSLQGSEQESGIITLAGSPFFADVKSIPNAPECHHCHGSTNPVLGSMVILMDSSESFASLNSTQAKVALISLLGLIALVGALVFFLKRTVISKVHSIEQVSDRISSGDLDLTFESRGEDELARLGQNLTRMVGTIKDQLQYNKSVLEGMKLPMFVTDKNEVVTFSNVQLADLLDKSEEELLGHTVSEAFYGKKAGSSLTAQVIANQEDLDTKTVLARYDGKQIPIRFAGSPLRNAEGEIVGAIGIIIDLTKEEEAKSQIENQQENLLHVANQVTEVAIQLSSAAEELSQQMNELAQGLDVSSDQTSQVATAMEEMNATVLEVARNAGDTASSAEDANSVARDGGEEVDKTVIEITQVAQTTVSLSETLNQLAGKVENIGQVMSVINDIADQTNLLALNAAIEAARAGDAGRGFAVVADEVRKLAEKTMQATKEVEKAITEIQSSTQEAVTEMDTTRTRVDNTTNMAKRAGEVLQDVMEKANRISDMVRNIATAAEQQSATSEEINNNVTQINVLTQESSQGVQQANLAIKEVAEMSMTLRALVEQFNKDRVN
ncbi:MAG: methyl-accepting chemotaxis protein [Desulfovibrionales bacterium]